MNVDCSGSLGGDALAGFYAPTGTEIPPSSFGTTQLESKIRGALLMPYDHCTSIPSFSLSVQRNLL